MFWVIIDRVVNLTFLLLALMIISVLISNSNKQDSEDKFILEVAALRQDFRKVMDANLLYLEKRQNKQAEIQDDYQTSTSRRIDTIEEDVKALKKENKDLKLAQKVINNNTNTNIVNGEAKQ